MTCGVTGLDKTPYPQTEGILTFIKEANFTTSPPPLMATTSSGFKLRTTLHLAELFTSHPLQSNLSLNSLSLTREPNTQIEISSNSKSNEYAISDCRKWRTRVSFLQGFLSKEKDVKSLKEELFEAIAPLDRGAEASPGDQERVNEIARKLEAVNKVKEPLKSNLLNGKWELLYTTSQSILQVKRPKWLRPNGKIYQAINVDTLRAQNMETWPFFNQVTANLVPLNARKVAVKFDFFRIAGLISIASPGSGRGQLEITYLDQDLRISRGDRGNLFILQMVDPSYRVPL
ncbi:probable plastid-lipid-associated protein 4, chloroplastic [Mercurialis annua]|uniref:probable plastid-lipid-associated protein 4, chloroplastic n=1 Tax=Mercurialis annua TaxID=3986 RepID=UPI00215DF4D9|nr:probable plastid-lipid-associated protein 4, chloroplastic [Mercurialis annua]